MEIIYAVVKDDELVEVRVVEDFISYNNVISMSASLSENDWEMQISEEEYELGYEIGEWIYVAESEFGGLIENIEHINGVVKLSGANFRGYLTKFVLTPKLVGGVFEAYLNVNKDANTMLWDLFGVDDTLNNSYIIGLSGLAGINVNYGFRFVTFLTGISRAFRLNGVRLETKHSYIDYANMANYITPDNWNGKNTFVFTMSAQPITDYSTMDTFTQDYTIEIDSGLITDKTRQYLWILGRGQLEDREIVLLKDGIEVDYTVEDISEAYQDGAVYDYPNAESREDLIKDGIKYWQENYATNEYISIDVADADIEFFLGDIIKAEDFVTGISTKAEITEKELNISNDKIQILYKVGGL